GGLGAGDVGGGHRTVLGQEQVAHVHESSSSSRVTMAGGEKPVKGIPKRQRQGNDDLVRHGVRWHARPPETAIPPAYALSRRRHEISSIGEFMAVNEARIPRSFFCFGASAGGIEALIAILDRLPTDLDATVAIVVHRSPTAASALVDIFARHSRMP